LFTYSENKKMSKPSIENDPILPTILIAGSDCPENECRTIHSSSSLFKSKSMVDMKNQLNKPDTDVTSFKTSKLLQNSKNALIPGPISEYFQDGRKFLSRCNLTSLIKEQNQNETISGNRTSLYINKKSKVSTFILFLLKLSSVNVFIFTGFAKRKY